MTDVAYNGYGRRYGRGLGLGLGPNVSPYCRRYPGMPRGWWANPAYASQGAYPQSPTITNMRGYQNASVQYPNQSMHPQQQVFPQAIQPEYYGSPNAYGLGAVRGFGMGFGRGMGMRFRWGMNRFGRGQFQY